MKPFSSMASRMTSFQSKRNYLFPTHNPIRNSDGVFEFDDSDLWVAHTNPTDQPKKMIMSTIPREPRRNSRTVTSTTAHDQKGVTSASSVPVNIPDWSKVMRENMMKRNDVEEYGEEEEEWVPPHVYLARNRGASFSVHEGVGRTLKGRDLRRVRNAIWKQVGFED